MSEKVFSLGKSLLYQGDYYETLSEVKNVRLIVTSPPYNIGSAGKRQDGMRKLGQFDRKSFSGINSYEDNLPEVDYQLQQQRFLLWALDRLKPDGVIAYHAL
jgi:DNA modification methylase